jgi:hypothetical protein
MRHDEKRENGVVGFRGDLHATIETDYATYEW